jgi:hypothetical protein
MTIILNLRASCSGSIVVGCEGTPIPAANRAPLRSAPEIDHKLRKRLCRKIHIPKIMIGEKEINVERDE